VAHNAKLTGNEAGALLEGGKLGAHRARRHRQDRVGARRSRQAAGRLPKLRQRGRIDLSDGRFWTLMSYRLRDEKAATLRWVSPGHSLSEFTNYRKGIADERRSSPIP